MSRPDDHRRKWDKELYEKLAREKKENESLSEKSGDVVKRSLLKAREHKVDFTSKIGKTLVISKTDPSQQGGFYCDICQCLLKDNKAYLDHLNGRNHQKNKGMSMKVERSSLDAIKNRFKMHKEKKNNKEEEKISYSYSERMQALQEEDDNYKAKQKEKRLNKKRKTQQKEETEDNENKNEDILNQMGFGSFASKKQKN